MERNFGQELRRLREKRGLTVNQLGIYSGVSPALISKLENGKRGIPKPETIEKIAKGLKMDYKELMKIAGYIDEEDMNKAIHSIKEKSQPYDERPYEEIINHIKEHYPDVDINDPSVVRKLKKAIDLVLDDYEKKQ